MKEPLLSARFALFSLLALLNLPAVGDYVEPKVDSIAVEGALPVSVDDLLDGTGLREGASLFSTTRSEVYKGALENLRSRGYLDARVEVEWPNWYDPEPLVVIDVNPGRQCLAGGLVFRGVEVLDTRRLARMFPLQAGDVLTPEAVQGFEDQVTRMYRELGYVRVRANVTVLAGDSSLADTGTVFRTLECVVEEDERVYLGEVRVEGTETVRDKVVRREIPLCRGDSLNMTLLREAVSEIYRLRLFREVRFGYEGLSEGRDTVDLVVRVTERDYHELDVGVGYLSPAAVITSLYWRHPNLWGNNQRLRIGGTYKRYFGSGGGDVFEPELTYVEPWFISTRWEATLRFSYTYFQLPSLEERKYGGELEIEREIARDLDYSIGYSLERGRHRTITESGEEDVSDWTTSSKVFSGIVYDTREPLLDPVRGEMASFGAMMSGGPLGGRSFYKFEAEFRYVKSIAEGLVLAWRLRSGVIHPFGGTEVVPPTERYYLGGGSTVRGYGFRDIGPEDGEGNPIGGKVMNLGNAEVRIGLWGILGAAVFVDAGGLWQSIYDVTAGSTGFGTGMGLRIATPFGPLRLDYGFAPTWREGFRRGRVYVALGHAF